MSEDRPQYGTDIVKREQPQGAFTTPAAFESAQRMARLLASSSLVPQNYRDNLPDAVIALEMANRIGASPLAVMQNLYIVHGRPAWSSQFLISCVNASGKFSPLRYLQTGVKGEDSWGCIAWAIDLSGERLESPEVTIGMAKAEGWYSKNGSKWKTMPELMLRYRCATLFARLFAPELTMGIRTDDEVIDVSPVVTEDGRTVYAADAQPVSPLLALRQKASNLGLDVPEGATGPQLEGMIKAARTPQDAPKAEGVPKDTPDPAKGAPGRTGGKKRTAAELATEAKKRGDAAAEANGKARSALMTELRQAIAEVPGEAIAQACAVGGINPRASLDDATSEQLEQAVDALRVWRAEHGEGGK